MNIYALIFYVLTFSFVGNPANEVIKHDLKSWKHPYNFESLAQCENIKLVIRAQNANLDYKDMCVKVDIR